MFIAPVIQPASIELGVYLQNTCSVLNRRSNKSAHVLLNLLNNLRKRDKMGYLSNILPLFCNVFNKFNNAGA